MKAGTRFYAARVTVLEAIQRSTEFLDRKGVDSPRLQAELLVAHVLQMPRMKLYLNFARALAAGEVEGCRELVRRRGTREPLQHILGTAVFCGLELEVNRAVLIPRPETESLAELGWQFLNHRVAGDRAAAVEALDFGTGSGCLAITLAVKCPAARVMALDVSAEALSVAGRNVARHGVGDRVECIEGDGLAAVPAERRFDLIISNPPYIPSAEIAGLQPEVRDFDPRLALDGGADGLESYRLLARDAGSLLRTGGHMMLEIGDGQAEALCALFTEAGWTVEAVHNDLHRRPRILELSRRG